MILSITGPSGVGKTTLLKNILRAKPEAHMLQSVTTRAPRPTDEPNFKYVDEVQFKKMEAQGEFLWTVYPHGKSYGTRKKAVADALAQGLYISVLVIEAVQKLHTLGHVIPLYIRIDDEEELRGRFLKRGDMNKEEVESRIAECRTWNKKATESGVPFIYLDGKQSPEELLERALTALNNPQE